MAVHPSNPRGAKRTAKRPSSTPFDRGRVTALEEAVEELRGAEQ